MGEVFERISSIKPISAVAEGLNKNKLRITDPSVPIYDPHVWFDVELWGEVSRAICKQLVSVYPKHKNYFENNFNNYLKKLIALDSSVYENIQSVPKNQRVLITAHDAFGYFGDAYNIEVKGLQGISTLSEFGLKDVADLVNFIVRRKIKAVFVETSVSEKSINAVVEGCRAKGHPVEVGGKLYSDAMGEQGTKEGTYIGMVRANVKTIVESLK